ncbi:hypothetical protein CDL15_Pgr027312 [Punica granatum]|uniref:Uncharacterized protein n=1 Tax=Punica granatum TaxID=22663 RepID=A0A218XSC2_PUNGR|nr:hypothetical protein CDL15_Pgr027312 [Punica granatum]
MLLRHADLQFQVALAILEDFCFDNASRSRSQRPRYEASKAPVSHAWAYRDILDDALPALSFDQTRSDHFQNAMNRPRKGMSGIWLWGSLLKGGYDPFWSYAKTKRKEKAWGNALPQVKRIHEFTPVARCTPFPLFFCCEGYPKLLGWHAWFAHCA